MLKKIIPCTVFLASFSTSAILATEPEHNNTPPHQQHTMTQTTPTEKQGPLSRFDRNFLSRNSVLGSFICKGTTIGLGLVTAGIYIPFSEWDHPYKYHIAGGSFVLGSFITHASSRTNPAVKHALTAVTSGSVATAATVAGGFFAGVCAVSYAVYWFMNDRLK